MSWSKKQNKPIKTDIFSGEFFLDSLSLLRHFLHPASQTGRFCLVTSAWYRNWEKAYFKFGKCQSKILFLCWAKMIPTAKPNAERKSQSVALSWFTDLKPGMDESWANGIGSGCWGTAHTLSAELYCRTTQLSCGLSFVETAKTLCSCLPVLCDPPGSCEAALVPGSDAVPDRTARNRPGGSFLTLPWSPCWYFSLFPTGNQVLTTKWWKFILYFQYAGRSLRARTDFF